MVSWQIWQKALKALSLEPRITLTCEAVLHNPPFKPLHIAERSMLPQCPVPKFLLHRQTHPHRATVYHCNTIRDAVVEELLCQRKTRDP